ncbi:MAG: hypothetical protein ACREIG_04515 [Nitrospiraceae bacterium]
MMHMIEELIVVFIMGLVGLMVVIVLKVLGFSNDHQTDDKWDARPSSELRDGAKPHEHPSRQSKVAA